MYKISSFKNVFGTLLWGVALVLGITLSMASLRAEIAFTGSGASPTLVGDSQTLSGVTNFEGEINFSTGLPAAWYYDSGSEIRYGEWSGEAIWGGKNYYFDGTEDFNYSLSSASGLWGTYVSSASPAISNFYSVSWTGTEVGESGVSNPSYRIGEYAPLRYSQGIRETHSGSLYRDAIFSTMLLNTATYPEEAHFIEATVDTSASSLAFRDSYFTWYRTANLPTGTWGQKTSRDYRINSIAGRSILAMSFGGNSNILKLQHPTNSAASMGIELNPSSGTIKINNVPVLTEAVAANTYVTPSGVTALGDARYVRLSASNLGLVGGTAVGSQAFAIGTGTANGNYSIATGGGVTGASATYATAMSWGEAQGEGSTALSGGIAYEDADYSTAISAGVTYGTASTAMSMGQALGEESTAIGYGILSESLGEVAVGQYNASNSTAAASSWVPTDNLFVIGNGTYDWEEVYRSNALVVRKNANMRTGGRLEAKGVIRCAPGGDLSMGSFTSSPAGLGNPATLNAALKYSGE